MAAAARATSSNMASRNGAPRRKAAAAALACAAASIALSTPSSAQAPDAQIKADAASLCALVAKMQVVAFRYGYDPVTAELRQLEPYAVGYTRRRNVLLFGRQVSGYAGSAAAALPGWRNFRIDKIDKGMVNARGSTFDPVRPDPGEHRYITDFVCKNEFVQ